MKKSSFIVWWLGIELLIELSKAHLPSNKTKQKNNYKPTLPPPPPHPPGISPPLAFLVWVAGPMVAAISVTLSVNGNKRKSCCGIRKS